ncbi:MAG: nucleotidyltransferase domain-containing protein [Nanoarchaeota archaeon]
MNIKSLSNVKNRRFLSTSKIENFLSIKLMEKIKADNDIIAVLLFGSLARNESNRDIDICLVLNKKFTNLEMSKKRLSYVSLVSNKIDIQIFQQLPLYIRKRILKEGKILLCKDEDALYNIAFSTIKEYNLYEKAYTFYLSSVK